jgi:hypothetical protein
LRDVSDWLRVLSTTAMGRRLLLFADNRSFGQ